MYVCMYVCMCVYACYMVNVVDTRLRYFRFLEEQLLCKWYYFNTTCALHTIWCSPYVVSGRVLPLGSYIDGKLFMGFM